MYLRSRLCLLVVFLALVAAEKGKSKTDRQGRTLGLLTPLLLGAGARPLYDVPVGPVGGSGAAGAATQSDQYYGGGATGGGGYPGQYYGNYYGYRPSYGFGFPGFVFGYPNYSNLLGYPSYGYNRPSYNYNNYAGYQRPTQYPGSFYGNRPNYNNYNNYGNAGNYNNYGSYGSTASYGNRPAAYPAPVNANPSSAVSSLGGSAAAGSQLNTAQASQIAGLLGQALGSSLRPLLANGGAGGAGAASINPQVLSNLLNSLRLTN